MKTFKVTGQRLSPQARAAIERTLKVHGDYANSYFWKPRPNAAGRRQREKDFQVSNYALDLGANGLVEVTSSYSESCNHCYYGLRVAHRGIQKNIRTLKSILSGKLRGAA